MKKMRVLLVQVGSMAPLARVRGALYQFAFVCDVVIWRVFMLITRPGKTE